MLPDSSSSEATPIESTDIIALEALLQAERQSVATVKKIIAILRLEVMQLAAHIMQANQAVEEVRRLHLEKEQVLLLMLSKAQGNHSFSLDTS
jgi:hypothetical protein